MPDVCFYSLKGNGVSTNTEDCTRSALDSLSGYLTCLSVCMPIISITFPLQKFGSLSFLSLKIVVL